MQVTLDDEQWTVNDDISLMEILALLSDRAHAKQRLVTSLQVGDHRLTDRDLTRSLLSKVGAEIGDVRASTKSMEQVIDGADETIQRYAAVLKADGTILLNGFRAGQTPGGTLDAWLGRLADYLECLETQRSHSPTGHSIQPVAPWVAHLLDARNRGDWVGLADLLEYEILTRLPG
jgi:hypothetical protein